MKEIIELYRTYGFEDESIKDHKASVFTISQGYFNNAEIVPHRDSTGAEISNLKENFERRGFNVRVKQVQAFRQLSDDLFNGFFRKPQVIKYLHSEYNRFANSISDRLGLSGGYSYVSGPYTSEVAAGEETVIGHVASLVNQSGAQLIILEAAAGFGKTCTSYEILSHLLNTSEKQIPMLMEFARGRKAGEFRFILLDGIDRNFSELSHKTVRERISEGKVVLILDGFDELIGEGISSNDEVLFDQAESMLDTISKYLVGEAKIVLTTRGTAMFDSNQFDLWRQSRETTFETTRVQISIPRVRDWLTQDKLDILKSNQVPIKAISNPVLLSFLRSLDFESQTAEALQPQALVDEYINRLLRRERERQQLELTVDEQLAVMQSLAVDMCRYNYNSADRETIQMFFQVECEPSLTKAQSRYDGASRPSLVEIANKLSNHALLDVKSTLKDSHGFLNDFILGTLIYKSILQNILSLESVPDPVRVLDIATPAASVMPPELRLTLYNLASDILEIAEASDSIRISARLLTKNILDYKDCSISNIEFDSFNFDNCHLSNVTFNGCSFRSLSFDFSLWSHVTFIQCSFYAVNFDRDSHHSSNSSVVFISCDGDSNFKVYINSVLTAIAVNSSQGNNELDLEILANFWPSGRQFARLRLRKSTTYKGIDKSRRHEVDASLESLESRGIISINGDTVILNKSAITMVRQVLNR